MTDAALAGNISIYLDMVIYMTLVSYFKALSDETRLRLLNLLSHHELNVNEIVSVMGMGQSRISRHLKILSDCGLVEFRRDGLWVFYRSRKDRTPGDVGEKIADILHSDTELRRDLEGLNEVIRKQSQEKTRFFDTLAASWDSVKGDILGPVNIADEVLARIGEGGIVADLGCGTGELLPFLKQRADVVIGVDKSPKMLEEARSRLGGGTEGIELRIGEMEHLPMRDHEADSAVLSMVLHHLPSPRDCIGEIARILKKGGRLVIADLEKHGNELMRTKYGHRWLGFSSEEMVQLLGDAGFRMDEVKGVPVSYDLTANIILSVLE